MNSLNYIDPMQKSNNYCTWVQQEALKAKSLKQLITHCWISRPKASRVVTVDSRRPGLAEQQISTLVSLTPLLSTSNCNSYKWKLIRKKKTPPPQITHWLPQEAEIYESIPWVNSWQTFHLVLHPWRCSLISVDLAPPPFLLADGLFSPAAPSCSLLCPQEWMFCPSGKKKYANYYGWKQNNQENIWGPCDEN